MKTSRLPRTSGVYIIKNVLSGRFYIGSAKTLRGRLDAHVRALNGDRHHNFHLQASWKKYGEDAFVVEVLEHVEDCGSLIDREQYYLDEMDAVCLGYNMAPTAGSTLGFEQPDHVCEAVASANRDRVWTPDMRKRHSDSQKAHWTDEKRKAVGERLRKYSKGRVVSEETREKLRQVSLGKSPSAETRKKLSAASKGRVCSPEQREKLSRAHKGRVFSEETRRKMSESAKRRCARQADQRRKDRVDRRRSFVRVFERLIKE